MKEKKEIIKTISVKEFAEAFGLNLTYQYEKIKQGKIPAIRIGRLYRIPMWYVESLFHQDQNEQFKKKLDETIEEFDLNFKD